MHGAEADYRGLLAQATEMGLVLRRHEPLARHTTFRIGGPADLHAAAADQEALLALVRLAERCGVPYTVLGGGSNVLISDRGLRGLVIANACRAIRRDGPVVVAESGAALAGLARWSMRAGLSGLEWAVSVPGTVGGAVIGNAGAHGSDISANLQWVRAAGAGGEVISLAAGDLGLAYRSSRLKSALLAGEAVPTLLEAAFALQPADPAAINAAADAYLEKRRASQPVEPSAGSIFRNPPGGYAGRMIEECGLKGHTLGGAQISLRHANFIINAGEATAADVRALIALVQERVKTTFDVELVPEILFLGEF